MPFDRECDLLVAGGGAAGAAAAITASELGARVVLVEKTDHLGGNCPYSGGNLLQVEGPHALAHLQALCFGRTPDDVLSSYLDGLSHLRGWLEDRGASTVDADTLPPCWPHMPGADGVRYYRVAGPGNGGAALWQALGAALADADVDVLTGTAVRDLLVEDGAVVGAEVQEEDGRSARVRARGGVVLATGGFENAPALREAHLPSPTTCSVGHEGNTGDGLRAAQRAGAALWHMSTFFGFWAFRAPDLDAAFPVILPGKSFLVVDAQARRFHDETAREVHDLLRSVGDVLPSRPNVPRLPVFAIFDRAVLDQAPLVVFDGPHGHRWSADNASEVASGWIRSASSPAALATQTGLDPAALEVAVAAFNEAAALGTDGDFHRAATSMAPLDTSALHSMALWPGVATTAGGPRRDGSARVLREDGSPVPGLYAAGGNGSVWGHLTEHGGGLSDALVFGTAAARHACLDRTAGAGRTPGVRTP